MPRAQEISVHLPFLRRYARALTGNQASGDAYVRVCLEAALADPDELESGFSARIALYSLFHKTWRAVAPRERNSQPASDEEHSAQLRLHRLVPDQRQALLLNALEGFSIKDIAQILDAEVEQVQEYIDAAMDEISQDIATRILIIEDEPVIALDLSNIVEELGHEVTEIATTHKEAVVAAQKERPGLVLADIRLADESSGIDAVKDILDDGRIPVIFITAYPERLLTGERPEPTFLITKPFLPDAVKAAVSQALFFYPPKHSSVLPS